MTYPLLMHKFFKGKLQALLTQYNAESVVKDGKNGLRDSKWSSIKRDKLVPQLLKVLDKKDMTEADSVDRYNQNFRSAVAHWLQYCDEERSIYNEKNSTDHQRTELEREYVTRMVNMGDHLSALYNIYKLSEKTEEAILEQRDSVALNRFGRVSALFDQLYADVRLSEEQYQNINDLIEQLEKMRVKFDTDFQESIRVMTEAQKQSKKQPQTESQQQANPDNNQQSDTNPVVLNALKDKQYDTKLNETLEAIFDAQYKAAVERAQRTPSAYVGYALTSAMHLTQWVVKDGGTLIYKAGAAIGEQILDLIVPTQGPSSTTINSEGTEEKPKVKL